MVEEIQKEWVVCREEGRAFHKEGPMVGSGTNSWNKEPGPSEEWRGQ